MYHITAALSATTIFLDDAAHGSVSAGIPLAFGLFALTWVGMAALAFYPALTGFRPQAGA